MSTISVPLESSLFIRVAQHVSDNGLGVDAVAAISRAVENWLEESDDTPSVGIGYQWKELFLPTGTTLRIKYSGEYKYARVENDYPCYMGVKYSPNQFASKITGTQRDAWRDIWVKRPEDKEYVIADMLRPVYKRVIAYLNEEPGKTAAEVATALFGKDGYQQRVNKDLLWLLEHGMVTRDGAGGSSAPYRYSAVTVEELL